MIKKHTDHGGGLDAAISKFGGRRDQWLDLSTGINPVPFTFDAIPDHFWTDLPDQKAQDALIQAARTFWNVPNGAAILPCAGLSQLIAQLPSLSEKATVQIDGPTYNEYENAFRLAGWELADTASVKVVVHPNNPDGRQAQEVTLVKHNGLVVIDESFCDVTPSKTLVHLANRKNVILLKGLGKFWGLAGLRLGFAIGDQVTINTLADKIGPWAVSGPAQHIGSQALSNVEWVEQTRARLNHDAKRLDDLLASAGITSLGGTDLFRLYETTDAIAFQNHLAKYFVWSRCFPYSKTWVRLGLPGNETDWEQLEKALLSI